MAAFVLVRLIVAHFFSCRDCTVLLLLIVKTWSVAHVVTDILVIWCLVNSCRVTDNITTSPYFDIIL